MKKISFPKRGDFYKTVRERVEHYFVSEDKNETGNWRMYLKTGIILTLLASSYIYLVFFADSLLSAVLSAFLLSQAFVLVGFNIMHDGNHGSYSKSKKINRLMGFTSDLVGSSNFFWRQKHNVLHHTYTNIDELDDDLHTSGLLRLSPNQDWHPLYRFQHFYAFFLYGFLTLSWILVSDFRKYFTGRIGEYEVRKPSGSEATIFFTAKILYLGYMVVLPLFFHPVLYVLIAFIGVHLVLGFTLSIVFQLAHTIEGNTFPVPDQLTGNIDNEWAIHEIETTVNFARWNRMVTWYLGGLNFQIEHHLFSKICHIHYPEISKIVEETCREFSVSYISYPTLRSAVVAHYRFLKMLGSRPDVSVSELSMA